MTKKNAELCEKIRGIELLSTSCLHAQPEDDLECEAHLTVSLAKIAEMSAEFLGKAHVYAYDIEWETDGIDPKKLGLPISVNLTVDQCDLDNLVDEIADIISDRSGWLVKSCKYRVQ